ncbi:MAG: nuclear transport factor 2 family protein [Pyrinomonadaceae bacterium]
MKKIILLISAATLFAACGAPATNTPANNANTNTNTAKPTAAAPTADSLLAMEKAASEAYAKGDGAYFEGMLSDKAVMSMGKDRMGKADIVSMIKTAKCEMKDGVKLSEPQMSKINDDTYAFTYKNDTTGSCTENGKSVDWKPTRAATVWVRNGEKWQAVWHGENEIMGAPAGDKKADDKKAEVKKEEPKKDDKAAATKTEAKPAANASSAANTAAAAAPAKLTPSANTDALTKAHAAGWEAFRNKDAKAFDGMLASTFAFVDPAGGYIGSKADTIKTWTETMKCEGITKTSFTEGFAQAASPTVEILMGKGNADGKCDGQPNGDLWQTAIYVKEGEAWKLAFMFESMPMPKA